MLMVKTRLGQSAIEGLGLFAEEDIPKGTVTWRFVPGFDQTFTPAEIERLPEAARLELSRYTYLHARTGKYVACLDNARFMNHSDNPNTEGGYNGPDDEGFDIATRDIAKGEELTCDYTLFDAETPIKLGLVPPPAHRNGSDTHHPAHSRSNGAQRANGMCGVAGPPPELELSPRPEELRVRNFEEPGPRIAPKPQQFERSTLTSIASLGPGARKRARPG